MEDDKVLRKAWVSVGFGMFQKNCFALSGKDIKGKMQNMKLSFGKTATRINKIDNFQNLLKKCKIKLLEFVPWHARLT